MTEAPGDDAATTVDYSDYYDLFETTPASDDSDSQASVGLLLPVLYCSVLVLGVLGNALVVWVLIRSRRRSSLTDVCLLSLAVSDLLTLSSLPLRALSAVDQRVLSTPVCLSVTALLTTGLFSAVFFMVLATLERYAIVVYQHSICSRKPPAKIALASFVWMLSLFVSLPNIAFAKVRETRSCGSEFPEGTAWMSVMYVNVLGWILPLIITSFCFCRIFRRSEGKQRVVRLLLAVLLVYFFFWTPYHIVTFLEFLQAVSGDEMIVVKQCVEALALTRCCLNPIIYTCAGQKFRKEVLSLLPSRISSPPSAESTSSESSCTLIA